MSAVCKSINALDSSDKLVGLARQTAGTSYALLNLRLVLDRAGIMKSRVFGIEPLVGSDFHQNPSTVGLEQAVYEACDCCGSPIAARNIYFDGGRFLCVSCRRRYAIENRRTDTPPSAD